MLDQAEIEFPVDWTYRIMCICDDSTEANLTKALNEMGVSVPVTAGNKSSSGKYITYKVTLVVKSREELNGFPQKLMANEFVKHVL